jgi:hypothetical protein
MMVLIPLPSGTSQSLGGDERDPAGVRKNHPQCQTPPLSSCQIAPTETTRVFCVGLGIFYLFIIIFLGRKVLYKTTYVATN